jgi:hypothetical protein
MKGRKTVIGSIGTALLVLIATVGVAQANVRNSIQPAHVYFGTVQTGDHPNRLVTLHNGTGANETIETVAISGSGGYVFTLAANTALLKGAGVPRCRTGLVLAPGMRCALDVRVHTVRVGWWRSVLRVTSSQGNFNSSELRAHVVAG